MVTLDQIDKERERRRREPLACYNSGGRVHEKQMAFHRSQARERWVFGGNRSGKTECGAVETVWIALGIHPYRLNLPNTCGWVVSPSSQVQRDVAQAKVLRYLPRRDILDVVMLTGSKQSPATGVIDFLLVRNAFGGVSRIGFKSCDQGREKFQGASLDYVWFDEEPPESIYEECRMRLLDRGGVLFATMTPLKGRSWVYDRIWLGAHEADELWTERMEWADNPFLDPAEIAYMTSQLSEDELSVRRYGRFSVGGGLVYSEYDPAVHRIAPFEVPREWYAGISIDPGLRNPLSAHWYAVDGDGTVYVIAEHYEAGRDVAYHARRIKEISASLGWPTDRYGNLSALIDSAASQHTLAADKSVTELFFEQGIAADPRVDKNVFGGIARVKALLAPADGSRPRLYIFSTCEHMLREIRGYVWADGDNPRKLDDHAMDDLRYFVCSRPAAARVPPQAKTAVQLDKERLARRLGTRGFAR